MKRKFATVLSCSVLLASQVASGNSVAQESFRVKRPSAAETADASGNQEAPLQATATMNLESPSIPAFRNAVHAWEAKNNPKLQAQTGTTDSAHHGFKSHLGSALLAVASVAGSVANSYVPIATVSGGRRTNEPEINVDAGHCPAMVDPAFQIPVRWWEALSQEEADPVMGPQWKLWLQAVQEVFKARARELRSTPGAASLHVIINPNGTIFNMSPYTGNERAHQNLPISEPTLMHLRDMVGTMGVFPPFPGGTKVRCYHLIFDGSAGI
ncbi:MAG: hypothetical protein HYX67_05115 [Candidatus Melainabacteria bacterium]|nr:hypothetical protein [Candidatus Melainabacteria bacterium]